MADPPAHRGDVARESFVSYFLNEEYFEDEDALLLLDADQRHPDDMLENLRTDMETHNLDMVCAHYYARKTNPVQSLCYELGDGTWPYLPMLHPPTEGLHEIACTGFGCVLIKKKVLKAVQAMLPRRASPVAIAPLPDVTGDWANFGPDFRFFYLARKAGYRLWLDANIESLHAVTVWLGHKSAKLLANPTGWADAAQDMLLQRLEIHGVTLEAFRQRKRILEARLEGLEEKAMEIVRRKQTGENVDLEEQQAMSVAIYQVQGKVMEMEAWIEWAEKYPTIERPDQLPTTENTTKQEAVTDDIDPDMVASMRQEAYRDNAIDLASLIPEVGDGQ